MYWRAKSTAWDINLKKFWQLVFYFTDRSILKFLSYYFSSFKELQKKQKFIFMITSWKNNMLCVNKVRNQWQKFLNNRKSIFLHKMWFQINFYCLVNFIYFCNYFFFKKNILLFLWLKSEKYTLALRMKTGFIIVKVESTGL